MMFARAIVASVAALCAGAHASAENLVVNPSFETGDFSGWTKVPASLGSGLSPTFPGYGRTGEYSLLFYGVGPEYDQLVQTIPTEQGRTYVLQLWINDTTVSGGGLKIWWEGNAVYDLAPIDLPLNQWKQLTFVVVSTGPSSELRVGVHARSGGVMLDDFSLVRATAAPCVIGGDADQNGSVNFQDITSVLANFGAACTP